MRTGSAPTRRKVFILITLVICLIALTNITFLFDGPHASKLPDAFFDTTSGSNNKDSDANSRTDVLRSRVTWDRGAVPRTKVVAHVPGWTIFDNLYIFKGTIYVVTDTPTSVPDRFDVTSTGLAIKNDPVALASLTPTDKELRVISPQQARDLFGKKAEIIDGISWLINDPPQFIAHYYHWSAELLFGFWRTYSSLDPSIPTTGNTCLPAIRRIIFPHAGADHWRDDVLMNQWVTRSAFPSIAMEFNSDWNDRAEMSVAYVLDRTIFSDRSAAGHGPLTKDTGRIQAEPSALPGSSHWWNTIRRNVLQVAGFGGDLGSPTINNPVITYISRQRGRRRKLLSEDHDRLVEELYKLRDTHGYEVNVVSMEKLTRAEQFQLAARTTIMMGVHGNGLTSLLWMNPSPRSTVMEFFFPRGFTKDYQYPTHALGMTHYGFWGNETFTYPDIPEVVYPEGFHGKEIPVDGVAVARLCVERLSLADS